MHQAGPTGHIICLHTGYLLGHDVTNSTAIREDCINAFRIY